MKGWCTMAASYSKVSGKYRITFEYERDAEGKRVRKYKTVMTEAEAKRLVTEFNYNQQKNLVIGPNGFKMKEFLEYWFEHSVKYNCEESTIYGYKNIIQKHAIPYLGALELQKLSSIHLQKYYKHLLDEKGLSPNTVWKHHANIRKALDYALKNQFVSRNVADAVELPKKKTYVGSAYNQAQLRDMLAKVTGTPIELPVHLAAYLGLRREEIVGLRWDNIDLENRIIHIVQVRLSVGKTSVVKEPKTGKSRRSLAIPDVLHTMLVKHKKRQGDLQAMLGSEYVDSGYVYVHDNGTPYRVNSITEQFGRFLEKHQLQKIRLHDLRHTFASLLNEAGVSLKSISEALGHSDIGITSKVYTHLFDKTHKGAIDAISNLLSGES